MSIEAIPLNENPWGWEEKDAWDLHFQNVDTLENLFNSLYRDRTVAYGNLINQILQSIVSSLSFSEKVLGFEEACQERDFNWKSIDSMFTSDALIIVFRTESETDSNKTSPSLPDQILSPFISTEVDCLLWHQVWRGRVKKYRKWSEDIRTKHEGRGFKIEKKSRFEIQQVLVAKKLAINFHISWLNEYAEKTHIGIPEVLVPSISYHKGTREFFFQGEKLGKPVKQNAALTTVMKLFLAENAVLDAHHRKITYEVLLNEPRNDGGNLFTGTHTKPEDFKDDVREWNTRFKNKKFRLFHQDGDGIGIWIERV